jgi:PadR family transcriptional regulator, regulatory protein AphA
VASGTKTPEQVIKGSDPLTRPTATVILGMLSFGSKSGYEIKSFVDRSTRFFWAASYGQIYPELRRLAQAGLITGTDASQGERRRTIYELTPAGRDALVAWLGKPPETFEMRHEGMLKLFFADALPPRERTERLRDMGRVHAEKLGALRVIEEAAGKSPDSSAYMVLRFGIDFNEWAAQWCEREALALEDRLTERSR